MGWCWSATDRFFSADIPEGRIMSQAPQPGVEVRRGWRVRVAESMGPQRMVIPNLIGGSERAAEINIRRRGLELGSIATATIPGGPTDQIVAQSPPANAVNVSAPKISVLLAAPLERNSFVMPDLVGRSEDDAVNAIVGAGLHVGTIASQQLRLARRLRRPIALPSRLRLVIALPQRPRLPLAARWSAPSQRPAREFMRARGLGWK